MANSLPELIATLDVQGITGAKRYETVRKFLAMKGRKSRTPVTGSFELTPLCNLDCKMCYVHLDKNQLNGATLLSLETWIKIAQEAIDAGMLYAQITGGECLTYPYFKEFYLFLRSKGIETTIKTNGLALTGTMLEFIVKHPPSLITVSVYGASDDGYEAVTGHRVFNEVINNIIKLQEKRIPLSISVTPSSYMKDGEKLLQLLNDMNLYWSINPLLVEPLEETGRSLADASLDTYAALWRKSFQLQEKKLSKPCNEVSLPPVGQSQAYAGVINCAAGRSSFAINWKGELSPCINFPNMHYNVLSIGFQKVWELLGNKIDSYPSPVECKGCAYSDICTPCVVAHANGAPIGHANRSICEWNRYMIKEGIFSL